MARPTRYKLLDTSCYYHITGRVAGAPTWFPLNKRMERQKLLEIIRLYTKTYCCEVTAYCIMGNHYHLLVHFEALRTLTRKQLWRRARLIYKNPDRVLRSDEQWERFNRRLFDLSELMRNIQAAFTRWYNQLRNRRGSFWSDRFHSTLLADQRAVRETLCYIELNPVRACLVRRPEQWRYSSACLRGMRGGDWLEGLNDLFGNQRTAARYRELLYYRGAVGTRKGGFRIPKSIYLSELDRGFDVAGVYCKRLRYFSEGIVLGSVAAVQDSLEWFRRRGCHLKRGKPIPHLAGMLHTLRQQRRTRMNPEPA